MIKETRNAYDKNGFTLCTVACLNRFRGKGHEKYLHTLTYIHCVLIDFI